MVPLAEPGPWAVRLKLQAPLVSGCRSGGGTSTDADAEVPRTIVLMRVGLILSLGAGVRGLMNGAIRKGYRHWTDNSGSNALEKRCCSSGMKKGWSMVGGEPVFMGA